MYLKSIEVNGFKSFAHKMIFQFNNGITGIVGPNGSGKSNVADAVRWVLGEQSAKQLRGAKMEDVIFSGTELRKPMGSAYVAITMDNSDGSLPIQFEEVTVARRVYRSGESEYLINGSPCRRKDIVELFFDTGVGKEGYSIIGQGQIDQILSGKPEDRRELFDEAAGIVKYKKNKAETQKSLDAERENLVRVTDILTELERQIGPLKKQSEKAKEYLIYRDQLKERDIKLFLLENKKISEELQLLDGKIEIATREMNEANVKMEKAKEKYEKEDRQLKNLNDKISQTTSDISEDKVNVQRHEGEIKVLEEQINTERTKHTYHLEEKERIEEEINEKKHQIEEIQAEADMIRRQFEDTTRIRVERESEAALYQKEIQELEEELSGLQEQISDFNSNQMKVSSQLERFHTVEEQLQVQIENLKHQKIMLEQELSGGHVSRQQLENKIADLKREKESLTIQIRNSQRITETLEKEGQELNHILAQKKEKFHRMQSNYETLRNMSERYDGYGYGIKKVMEQKHKVPGIIGAVADIVKVDSMYESAIETALGGSIQNIVTDTQNTAKELIEFLKRNRYGRVTFLPLDAVKGKSFARREILSEPGVVGPANELVSYDQRYSDLFASLLGQVLVVKDMDAGISIANKYHHSVRIVTLDGDGLNRGGSMSGGAFKNKGNLLGRNREVKDLKEKLEKIRVVLQENEDKCYENEKRVREYQETVVRLNKEYQQILLELNTQEMSLSAFSHQEEDLTNRIGTLKQQIEVLETEKENAVVDARELLDKKNDLEIANKTDEQKIEEIENKLAVLHKKADEQSRIIAEIHMKSGQLKQKLEFEESNHARVRFEVEKLVSGLKLNDENARNTTGTVQKIEDQIRQLKMYIRETSDAVEMKKENLEKMKTEVEARTEIYKKTMQEREEIMERASGYDKEVFRLTGAKEKQEEKQQELLDYMWDNYEITYNQAKVTITEEITESLTRLKEEITDIKSNIRTLGPVNVNAIEDYREISERYEFLQRQHEDIVKAEAHLTSLIKELEDAMRRQFDEKFKDIQDMFQKVFVELFGGGVAKLELTDDDVLESGIRIIAQPPGKKLQNMMQLSGGEKALTAISLLFAIQNLKPSPFCLLDEIEAALDDSNVTRFARYLHKLTKETQFIVITHRRGTMMAADVLYGITMQEKGVSTQVSVNLIEKDLEE
ncbi:chromosome segregation protein SMC [Anaerostipes sp. 494a]|uniref:chromosome segregation protein SMC n=1 Tax=Anaerostipes sp. 494a TaxID=1261636 RepID=UPI0009533BF7|nr:chromosome segregation protein SMC [Anaerostipes sp. 494a]OLR58829.1 chromosome segregation protein SMC [Anaerostipes sp. 494a]